MTEQKADDTVFQLPRGTKVSYLRDENNLDRVLTVVRTFDRRTGRVTYGWSINCPPRWVSETSRTRGSDAVVTTCTKLPGDGFCRKVGRTLALLRMTSTPHTVYIYGSNQSPLRAALVGLANDDDVPYHVRDIVRQHLPLIEDRKPRQHVAPKRNVLDRFVSWLRGA